MRLIALILTLFAWASCFAEERPFDPHKYLYDFNQGVLSSSKFTNANAATKKNIIQKYGITEAEVKAAEISVRGLIQKIHIGDLFKDIKSKYGNFEVDEGSSANNLLYRKGELHIAVDKKTSRVSSFQYLCNPSNPSNNVFKDISCYENSESVKRKLNHSLAVYCDNNDRQVKILHSNKLNLLLILTKDKLTEFIFATPQQLVSVIKSSTSVCETQSYPNEVSRMMQYQSSIPYNYSPPPVYMPPPNYSQENDYSNELARQALEEAKAARADAQRQRAIDALRESNRQAEDQRKADIEQMLQIQQRSMDANQKKIDRDWGIFR